MTTPIDYLTDPVRTDYVASGPAAGLQANMDQQNYQDAQARAFRNNDLSYANDYNTYQNNVADNPVKEAQRKLDLANKGMDQSMIDSGLVMQDKQATMEAHIQKSLSDKTAGQLADIDAKAQFGLGANTGMVEEKTSVDFMKNKDYYENSVLPHAKALGVTDLPKEWGPQAKARLQQMEQQATVTAPFIQKTRLANQEIASKERIANIEGEYKVRAAAAQGENAARQSVLNMDPDKLLEKQIIQKAETGTLTKEDLTAYKAVLMKTYKASPEASVGKTADETDASFLKPEPEKYAALMKTVDLPKDASVSSYVQKKLDQRAEAYATKMARDRLGASTFDKVDQGKSAPAAPRPNIAPTRAGTTPAGLPKGAVPQPDGTVLYNGVTYAPKGKAAAPVADPVARAMAPDPNAMVNQIPQ
jgi:hypothetical protein